MTQTGISVRQHASADVAPELYETDREHSHREEPDA